MRRKIQAVNEIKAKLETAKSVVVVNYLGIKVEDDTVLRRELRDAGVEYKVIKNNLVERACQGTQFESLTKDLVGANAFAFGYDDPVAPAKVLKTASEKFKAVELKSAVIDGEYYDADGVKLVASIPSREVLIAKFLGSIKSPVSKLAYMLSAIAEKKTSEEA